MALLPWYVSASIAELNRDMGLMLRKASDVLKSDSEACQGPVFFCVMCGEGSRESRWYYLLATRGMLIQYDSED